MINFESRVFVALQSLDVFHFCFIPEKGRKFCFELANFDVMYIIIRVRLFFFSLSLSLCALESKDEVGSCPRRSETIENRSVGKLF